MSISDRDAYIVLNMISGIGSARLEALLSNFSTPSKILSAGISSLERTSGISRKLAESIASWQDTIDYKAELGLAEKGGVKIVTRIDDGYPEILKQIYDPPICLYVRGEIPESLELSIAVVGSRRMTSYGQRMARHLTESAVFAGWTVISGLAYGVDAVAHQAALDAGGKTVAVLGGGLARIHPQDHVPLARDISDNGAVISEFPMEHPVTRQSFPRRNRIVSGLSRATLVVEAGLNSGALITANTALDQNRQVFAVPGQADNPQARGCNALIRQGAKLTESFDDVIDEFEFLPGLGSVKKNEDEDQPEEETHNIGDLSPEEQLIMTSLKDGEKSVDGIAADSELPPGKLLAMLMKLEMKKAVKQLPGKIYSLK